MPTAQQDTEITLGTGRMLAIFFGFVIICAFFFALGFSLGRKTTLASIGGLASTPSGGAPAGVRPTAEKKATTPPANSTDFSFYKAVGEKSADSGLTPADSTSKTPSTASPAASAPTAPTPSAAPDLTPAGSGYFVQVAAVSRKEDAESLVEALKKKQYPAFSANNPTLDKFYHVQVGPFGELKDAEAMRARLISDGYNPIVKK